MKLTSSINPEEWTNPFLPFSFSFLLLLLSLGRLSALFFLLALADNFRFRRSFAFDWSRCCYRLFLDNTHGRDRRIGICQNFNPGAHRNVRNVQHIVNRQICNIDLQRFRNLARLAADFDVPNNLFEHTSLLTHANRFSHKTQWHRRLDLFAFYQPLEVRVDQAHAHRIDLPVNEHNFTGPDAFNIDREDRVASGIGSQDGGQLTQWR